MVVGASGVSGIRAADHVDQERRLDHVAVIHPDHSTMDRIVRDPLWKHLPVTSDHAQVPTHTIT